MGTLTIELPNQRAQTIFNLERWSEIISNPALAKIEGRIEMDRFGHLIMSPPPAAQHARYQSKIVRLLSNLLSSGEAIPECPVSTADGVRAADVAWASPDSLKQLGTRVCFPVAPEICVEILSPGNTDQEISEKMALYFDAGAREVWLCSVNGEMQFYEGTAQIMARSAICPKFPKVVPLG